MILTKKMQQSKEFCLKHLFANHETAANRIKVLELLKNKPLKLKHYNLRRILKNYPNMNLTKNDNLKIVSVFSSLRNKFVA